MQFNTHSHLEGRHAFLSASKGHWINYDEQKLADSYYTSMAAALGTRLHAFAAEAISLGVRLQGRKTLAAFVNDAIGFKMIPEQILYYSEHAFGTADAISYNTEKKSLRIHDLKTGKNPCGFRQLEIYAAFFCLEYRVKPHDIWISMRLYQNDEVQEAIADPDTIVHIMDRVVTYSKKIDEVRALSL